MTPTTVRATTSQEPPPLRFAANLKWLFTDLPMPERFTAAAAAGFRAVECPNPYGYSVASLERMVGAAGVAMVLINTPPASVDGQMRTGIACDPRRRGEFKDGVERGLEYATGLGVPMLHIVAGTVPEGVSFDRAWAEFLLNIAWAADVAKDTEISLLVEPQNDTSSPGFLLTTQTQAATVIDAIGSDRLGVLFDVFHAQMQEGGVSVKLKELAPVLRHVQIADAPDRTEPGTGELSWPHVFGVLREIGYGGWIGCEYSATKPRGAHAEWLTSIEGDRV